MVDTYQTIAREARIEIKVKGSRFIGESRLTDGVDDALGMLDAIRRREFAATHHCWAYRIGTDGTPVFKYSDDGEPGGTAGRPIFDALEGNAITNCLLVVTRYFGGTKLGTGGLARAYSETARQTLDASGVKTCYHTVDYELEMEFPFYNPVHQLLARLQAETTESYFTDRVRLRIAVRRSLAERLEQEYAESTQGKATIIRLGPTSAG